jgi:hypothetical protein
MPYTVNYTNPSRTPISILDTTANNSTSLTLIGKQYDQYGEVIAENFVKLLENFSYTSAPNNPTPGQVWHDSGNKKLKVFDNAGIWKPLSAVYTGITSPVTNAAQASGDLWANTATGEIFIYNGSAWIELGTQTQNTGLRTTSRIDNNTSATHYTIEAVNDTKTVFVISTEDGWTPAASEKLPDNSVMNLSYPIIYKGINFDITGAYGVHNLSTTRINVGRGNVILQNNSFDAVDGAGITLKTSDNPINGSIFSVRSSGDTSRLWVGQTITTTGKNDFYVGFDGSTGQEYDATKYNIMLGLDGNISAKSITGNWIATSAESITGTISNKIVTPSTLKAATDARITAHISSDDLSRATQAEATSSLAIANMANDKVMTPARTRQAIEQYSPSIVLQQINTYMSGSLNPNGYQRFANGLLLQWGKATVSGNSSITVTFTQPYTSNETVFAVISTPIGTTAGGGTEDFWGVFNITKTTFEQHTRYDGTRSFYWVSLGI